MEFGNISSVYVRLFCVCNFTFSLQDNIGSSKQFEDVAVYEAFRHSEPHHPETPIMENYVAYIKLCT